MHFKENFSELRTQKETGWASIQHDQNAIYITDRNSWILWIPFYGPFCARSFGFMAGAKRGKRRECQGAFTLASCF